MISKPTINKLAFTSLLAGLLAPLALLVPQASAAVDTCTWTGGGADSNFNTTGNWNCSVDGAAAVPENGDSLEFGVSILTTNETITNDITGLSVAGITRSGDSGIDDQFTYTVDGNDITLTGPIVGAGEDEFGQLRLETGLILGSDITLTNMRGVFIDPGGSVDNAGFTITVQGATNTTPIYLRDVFGSGNITVESRRLTLSASSAQSFTGDLTISGGFTSVFPNAVNTSSSVAVSNSGVLNLAVGTYDNPFTLGGVGGDCLSTTDCSLRVGEGFNASDAVILSGGVTLNSDIAVVANNNLEIDGDFTDNGFELNLLSGSSGSITLPGEEAVEVPKETVTIGADDKNSTFLSVVFNQTVVLNGERGSVFVNSGGTLKGTGTVTGSVFISDGGILAPGLSPGCITSGSLNIDGTYEVEIAGVTVCTEYDQTDVTGTVEVTGATLDTSILDDFVPNVGNTFVIINNDEADAVTGEFDGLTNGATFEVDGVTFRINYDGGDGNDVVLTVTQVVVAPDTGIEQMLLNNPALTGLAAVASLVALSAVRFTSKR